LFRAEPLLCEYRGRIAENVHYGYICLVDEASKPLFCAGDPGAYIYYRSSSKPLQALPVIARGLDRKYGLTPEETVIFSGSHAGEEFHARALESLLQKTGLDEEKLILKPAWPGDAPSREALIRKGRPMRRIYHNCAGKHIASMLLQRELGGPPEDYWRAGSLAQTEIVRAVAALSEIDPGDVKSGVDGCGVPVFAVPVKNFAAAYKNLACIDTITDDSLREAAARYVPLIHTYSRMMRGTGLLCSLINDDANIIGKGGAAGAYGFGMKAERRGAALKIQDGTEAAWPLLIRGLLEQMGYQNQDTLAMLERLNSGRILNSNDAEVGYSELLFEAGSNTQEPACTGEP
jgi:L-asparaginase II